MTTQTKQLNFPVNQETDNKVQALAAVEAVELQELRAHLLNKGLKHEVDNLDEEKKDFYQQQLKHMVNQ